MTTDSGVAAAASPGRPDASASWPGRFETAAWWLLPLFVFALPLSVAASGILLTTLLAVWAGLLVTAGERPAVPAFFWPLAAYSGWTLATVPFSIDPTASLIESREVLLYLTVPVVYRLARGERARSMTNVVLTAGALTAAIGIVQYGILEFDNLGRRPSGSMGHYMDRRPRRGRPPARAARPPPAARRTGRPARRLLRGSGYGHRPRALDLRSVQPDEPRPGRDVHGGRRHGARPSPHRSRPGNGAAALRGVPPRQCGERRQSPPAQRPDADRRRARAAGPGALGLVRGRRNPRPGPALPPAGDAHARRRRSRRGRRHAGGRAVRIQLRRLGVPPALSRVDNAARRGRCAGPRRRCCVGAGILL